MKLTKCKMSVTSGVLIIGFLSLVILLVGQLSAQDKETPSSSAESQLAKAMIGTWVLVGTPDEVGEPPAAGGRLKFLTGRHWNITQADPNTGLVIYHHGGTYTLDGDKYTEKVEYANKDTDYLIKEILKFKIKVEKDTYTQIGIGNPYTEVWKRLK
ncbi:MAG: hypothetical protein ACYTBV_15810 [Planctomycetota bacterium]|jgi:hypothetical protein